MGDIHDISLDLITEEDTLSSPDSDDPEVDNDLAALFALRHGIPLLPIIPSHQPTSTELPSETHTLLNFETDAGEKAHLCNSTTTDLTCCVCSIPILGI